MKIVLAGLTMALITGCSVFNPEGFELGGKLGLYSIQDRQVSEQVSTKPRPFICNFRACDAQGNVINQGS